MNEGVRGPCSTHTPSRQPEATRAGAHLLRATLALNPAEVDVVFAEGR